MEYFNWYYVHLNMWSIFIAVYTCKFSCVSCIFADSDVFLETANWMVWPAIQIVNLGFVPLRFQVLSVNIAALPWYRWTYIFIYIFIVILSFI